MVWVFPALSETYMFISTSPEVSIVMLYETFHDEGVASLLGNSPNAGENDTLPQRPDSVSLALPFTTNLALPKPMPSL